MTRRHAELADLVERGLDPEQGILLVIDGAKPLRKTIRNAFGEAPVQRCVRHKERNVTDHLPERERPAILQRLRRAWARSTTTTGRSTSCRCSPQNSTAATPARALRWTAAGQVPGGNAYPRRSFGSCLPLSVTSSDQLLANLDLKHVLAFDDSKNAVEAARPARTECDHVLVFDPPQSSARPGRRTRHHRGVAH